MRTNNQRHRAEVITVSLLLVFLTGCGSAKPAPAIIIGDIAPRSGAQRDLGLHAEEAIRLALEEAKGSDGVLSGRTVEVRYADSEATPDATQADTTQSVAVRLLKVNHAVALIGSDDPASAERLCRIGQQYQVPVIVPVWLPASALGSYGFALASTPAEQGKALAEFATTHLKPTRIAVLVDSRSAGNIARAGAFVDAVGKAATVRREEFSSDEQMNDAVRSSLTAEPPAIFFAGNPVDVEKLGTEIRKGKKQGGVPILYAGEESYRLANIADRLAGTEVYWTTPFLAENALPAAKDFIKKYQEQYKRLPDAEAAFAYDAVRMLLEAIRQARTARPERVHDELTKLKDFSSLTGPVSFDSNQVARRPAVVVTRQNQQWKWFPASSAQAAEKGEPKSP
jgi:branched-chain amino acid transport system substrate-binding protein